MGRIISAFGYGDREASGMRFQLEQKDAIAAQAKVERLDDNSIFNMAAPGAVHLL